MNKPKCKKKNMKQIRYEKQIKYEKTQNKKQT